jgi:hypothetical protein
MFRRTTTIVLCAAAAAVGLGACSEEEPAERGAAARASDEGPPAPDLEVDITEPFDGDDTTSNRVTVRGTVSPAEARVRVNGTNADVDAGGSWSVRVDDLDLGEQQLTARATLGDSTERASDTVSVTRKRTAAQRAAYRAAQERKRQERLTTLKATAEWIAPKLLQKSPDRYTGDSIAISGEIFQIQEDGEENFFLMNTECETEYDITICDGPEVHVTYTGSTDKTEDDLVTVYGTVLGGLEYDTQIGGSNFVASVKGEVIE